MVRIDFPLDLTRPEFQESLIRENPEDFITKVRVTNAQTHDRLKRFFNSVSGPAKPDKIQDFFAALGLEEKETLNGVAKAGSCQFSCLADQLYGRECTKEWRADILLRKLALYVIATNEDEFRSFMLHANPKTRRQNKTAGESVDIEGYVAKMTNNSTDGDHLTLQALCDALQCPIHIVQLVDHPRAEKITMASSSVKTVVINDLHPRTLPHLHPKTARLQVQRRELWLTLHGEAHFRSLHSTNFSEEEAEVAKAELVALQTSLPDPPPTPTNHRLLHAPPTPPSETCSICFVDVVVVKLPDVLVPRVEEPMRPNTCAHIFHLKCIEPWSKMANTCPNCKAHFQTLDRVLGGKSITVVDKRAGARGNYNNLGRSGAFNLAGYSGAYEEHDDDEEEDSDDPDDPTDTIRCYVCDHANHSSVLLLCDGPGCPKSAHTWCVGLTSVPRGQWFCDDCTARRARLNTGSNDRDEERLGESSGGGSARRLSSSRSRGGGSIATNSSSSSLVDSVSGGSSSRRRGRASIENPLAQEIERRHAAEGVLTSVAPWSRVLEGANRAEEERRERVAAAIVAATATGEVASNAAMQESSPAAILSTAAPVVVPSIGAAPASHHDEEARKALAAREAALTSLQKQPARRTPAITITTSNRLGARKVYEISSGSEDEGREEEDEEEDMMAQRGVSGGGESSMRTETGGTPSADNPQAPAEQRMPIRPTVKRPRVLAPPPLAVPSSSSMGSANSNSSSSNGAAGATSAVAVDVRGMIAKLERAADADVESVARGWPPTEIARAQADLSAIFLWDQRDQARILNAGLLKVLRRCLDPVPGRAVVPAHIKAVIFRLLQVLPIGMNHLKDSDINRVLLEVCSQPGESRANRQLVQNLIRNWSRFVHNVTGNGAVHVHHKGRFSPYSPPAYSINSSSSSYHHHHHHGGSSSSSAAVGPERLFMSGALSPPANQLRPFSS